MSAVDRSLHDLASAAVDALTGERWAITDAAQHVPKRPGLYAIYGDAQAWRDLQLESALDSALYVGKAEESLISRDLNGHFATNPNSTPRTGGSTVRRSFAALLRESLDLHAVPRNLAKPERFANYGLADGGDACLNEWMHARLTLAVWPALAGMAVPLGDVETAVIVRFTPPINLDKNPGKLARLSAARSEMAAEAATWRPES
ncbi:GIY-YIG nuclease family protein [Microbacterium sp. NPDC089321]|uniref:GIY-YIG nuclease family protein n=1 Tax=Microbacterium sp. NPDC089321 TaxID=3155183 RepID=UPI00341A0CE6